VSAEKIAVIYNWCDESSIQRDQPVNDFIRKFKLPGKFIVLFAGTMGKVQGMDTLLMAAKQCSEKLPEVHFILAGGGVEKKKLEKQAAEMELNNVTFLPPRPIETMGEVFAVADVLLVHLKDDPLFRITIPSKTQAYLYVGKPVIMAVHGDAAELIKKAEAGVVCNPEDPTAIARAVESMYKMDEKELATMGHNARVYYENELSLNAGVLKFEKIFDELVKTNNI
jgi:glycosyltransferase involved in cell wall biosynthesis